MSGTRIYKESGDVYKPNYYCSRCFEFNIEGVFVKFDSGEITNKCSHCQHEGWFVTKEESIKMKRCKKLKQLL